MRKPSGLIGSVTNQICSQNPFLFNISEEIVRIDNKRPTSANTKYKDKTTLIVFLNVTGNARLQIVLYNNSDPHKFIQKTPRSK